MIAGPLSDTTLGWRYAFAITHCVWAGSQLALVALSRRIDMSAVRLRGFLTPLVLIPGALAVAMISTRAGVGPYVPAPPTLALSAALALIWGGVALQIWTVHRWMAARAAASEATRRRLLATGPYRISRNPELTGGYTTLIGVALGFGTVLALVVVSVAGALGFGSILTRDAPRRIDPSPGSRWLLIPLIW